MSSEHRFVYVAQPIDFRGEHDLVLGWVTNLVSGVVAYSPAHAWKIGSQVTELNASIQAGNMHMLDQSAAMVAACSGVMLRRMVSREASLDGSSSVLRNSERITCTLR